MLNKKLNTRTNFVPQLDVEMLNKHTKPVNPSTAFTRYMRDAHPNTDVGDCIMMLYDVENYYELAYLAHLYDRPVKHTKNECEVLTYIYAKMDMIASTYCVSKLNDKYLAWNVNGYETYGKSFDKNGGKKYHG